MIRFPFFTGMVVRAQGMAFVFCMLVLVFFHKHAVIIGTGAAGVYVLLLLMDLKKRADLLKLDISSAELLIMAVEDSGKKFAGEFAKVWFGARTGAFYL